jgi:hypothetical protein
MPVGGSVETIVCANHPARRASLVCERCGSYACSDCAMDAPWGTSVCAPCKERGGLRYPLVWERGSLLNPLRFLRSAKAILLDAPTLFANLPEGGVARALAFSAWVAVCLALSRLLADALQMRFDWHDGPTLRTLALYALSQCVRQAVQTYTLVLISALGFYAAVRAFGGHGSGAIAIRAAAYGSAFLLYNVVTTLTGTLAPVLEFAALVVSAMTQAYFYFTCLSITAVEHYGVSRTRAEVVAGVTVGVLVPSMLASMLLVAVVSTYCDRLVSWLLR